MAVFRVERNKGYTVMSNHHLRNRNQAQNEYGEEIMITAEDGLAQCFCHELEHLDGEMFLDKAIEEIDIQEL